MIARYILVIAAAACFALGYFGVDRWQARRIWRPAPLGIDLPATGRGGESPPKHRSSNIRFDDAAGSLGVDCNYFDGAVGDFHIMETTGGGVAVCDYDNDGFFDLYFVNGTRLPADNADQEHACKLFANRAKDGFEDVSAAASARVVLYGQGAAVGDFDNDGFDDLFVTGYGRLVLLRNQGDGTFAGVSSTSGVHSDRWGTSAAFGDLDGDGCLDLYVCTYVHADVANPIRCGRGELRTHCGPLNYPAQPDLFFRNRSDGTFEEVAAAWGVADSNGRGLGVVIADLNADNHPDVFVANDNSENFLFINDRGKRLRNRALQIGVALRGEGAIMAAMGVACADYDDNGWLDLFVTDFYEAENALFSNLGDSGFIDAAAAAGLAASSRNRLGFGAVFLDADIDGQLDLFVANGHVSDLSSIGIPYRMRQQFYRSTGNGRFDDVSQSSGPYFRRDLLGRGVAHADFDNDGRPDLACNHLRDPASLLLNRTTPVGNWVGLDCIGSRSNRSAVGVKAWVMAAEKSRYFESIGGGSYLSASDRRMIITLAKDAALGAIRIRWPSGREQTLASPPLGQYHTVREP